VPQIHEQFLGRRTGADEPRRGGADEMGSDDDRDAFAAAMRGVKKTRHAPRAARPARAHASTRAAPAADAGRSGNAARRSSPPERVLRQLRRGKIRATAELDLHGSTAVEAAALLDDFLAECRDRGVECARVVHGKGHRSGPKGPVLKGIVHERLALAPDVVAFVSAEPRHGGSGAVLVLLRR
jgi:DNA-nicking Smr family endonuclease